MDRCLLIISTLALVSCKPQYQINDGVEISQDTNPKVTLIPFYGGGKGQSLQVTEFSNGSVMTMIIKTPQPEQSEEEIVNAAELENPPLPTRQEFDGFNENLKNIHETALNIIKLQEIAKNGKLNQAQEESYQKNMDSLNFSAQNLARVQEETDGLTFENREGLSEWFERKKTSTNKKDKDKKKKEEEEKKKKEAEEEEKRKKQEEEKRKEEEEKKKKQKPKEEEEEEEEEIVENEDDSITIGLPPDEASVAEAKPVGLAVAGEGGVAASKPIATAVVGPGGLAIARPVGTAIAGVSPDQALVPIYAEGYVVGASKPKRYGSTKKPDVASEYLNKIISKYHQN